MADNTLLKVGLFAGAGYIAYQAGWLSFLGLGPSAAASTPATAAGGTSTTSTTTKAPATPPAPDPFAASGLNSLDKVYQALGKAGGTGTHNADEWNYYLMQVVPNFTAPDPVSLFSSANFTPAWTRDMQLALGAYWTVMAPYLAQKQGLSGVGYYASAYRGLGALAHQYRRAR